MCKFPTVSFRLCLQIQCLLMTYKLANGKKGVKYYVRQFSDFFEFIDILYAYNKTELLPLKYLEIT